MASASIKARQTLNRYSYGNNSPYRFTDPIGLSSNCVAGSCTESQYDATQDQIDSGKEQERKFNEGLATYIFDRLSQGYLDDTSGMTASMFTMSSGDSAGSHDGGPATNDGDNLITVDRKTYSIYMEGDRENTEANLPDEVNDILNAFSQGVANNELKALIAKDVLELFPSQSYSVSFDSSISSSGLSLGRGESTTYTSTSSVYAAKLQANLELEAKAYDKLRSVRAIDPLWSKKSDSLRPTATLEWIKAALLYRNIANLLLDKARQTAVSAAITRKKEMNQ